MARIASTLVEQFSKRKSQAEAARAKWREFAENCPTFQEGNIHTNEQFVADFKRFVELRNEYCRLNEAAAVLEMRYRNQRAAEKKKEEKNAKEWAEINAKIEAEDEQQRKERERYEYY
jgi:hypothetical protein